MIKLFHHKNSLDNSSLTSSKHTNQPIQQCSTHPIQQYLTHTQKHNYLTHSQKHNANSKRKTQSFILSKTQYQKLTKQLQPHKKHNSSFNQSLFGTKNIEKQSNLINKKQSNLINKKQSNLINKKQQINQSNKQYSSQSNNKQPSNHTRKSSSKHKKQRTTFSLISHQKHNNKGAIKKNRIDQDISSYHSNKNHLNSFDSNLQTSKIRKRQNRSSALQNTLQNNQDLKRQDNVKTDYQQRPHTVQFKKKKTQQQTQFIDQNNQYHAVFHKENIHPNIRMDEIQRLDEMTSKRISQLQSRSQTIDLLKFTIKTKLSKDIPNDSQHCFNSLMSSDNKSSQRQYIQEILKLKDLQANFYIDKISSLQNELNKTRKQRKSIQQEIYIKCNQNNRKQMIEKIRFQEENQLLKRQNEALRSIILKKINKRQSF